MWFGKNELRLYLNRAKKISIGGGAAAPAPPSKYAHAERPLQCHPEQLDYIKTRPTIIAM